MHLKKLNIFRLSILILLVGTSILSIYAISSGVSEEDDILYEKGYIDTKTLQLSQPFEFIQDFEASTSYISPESSPGFNDEVLFSFMTNKGGNYTIDVNNFPSLLTNTIETEDNVAFDNPSGTDLWYIAYLEVDIELDGVNLKRFGDYEIKFMKSEDNGETWNSTTVATISPSGSNLFELINDLEECAIAAYPEKGMVGIVTWFNASDLLFFSSFDNGSTWNPPEIVSTVKDIGYTITPAYPFHPWHGGPALEIGILKNDSIYVITEKPFDNPNLTASIYFESHNNGEDWSGAKNITAMDNIPFAEPVKMQVDHQTGDYWLMWEHWTGFDYEITWAQYKETSDETLESLVPIQIIHNGPECNFDFLYDKDNNLFRVIQIFRKNTPSGPKFEVISRSTSSYGPFGPGNSLGFHNAFFQKYPSSTTFNFAYDGQYFQFFFEETYSANSEVYQYVLYENPVFWQEKGDFEPFELKQVFWNGKTMKNSPINISTVKVILFVQNDTKTLNQTLYITIDNEYPEFEEFYQKNHYFNPLSSNITLSQIPWDLLGSEECDAILEVFKQGSSLSDWQRITDNNLQERDPKIFRSDTGELYILYSTMEVGTSTINLIKSFDNGITWSKPVEIATFAGLGTPRYWGAASGHIVIIYLFDPTNFDHVIYRSFDAGETFEPPIIPSDLNMILSDSVSKIILTRNHTLFLAYNIYPYTYRVLRSDTLGFDWTISGEWTNNSANFSTILYNRLPDLAYDHENDLVHIVMPFVNNSAIDQYHVANFTFATLNLTTNVWGEAKGVSTAPFPIGYFISDPKFLVLFNDNPINHVKIAVRYIHEQQITGGLTNYTFKEIVSTDLGETWSGPKIIETNNATVFTSSLFDIFYASTKSDGHDYEVYFSREGSLVKAKQESLSPTIVKEIT
ncbi:MAG: sialidase family protein, partial [Promethearchaeota archaeon]